jgi:hypothetical protein
VTHVNEHWASMSGPGGSIDFWSVPNHQPPTWPDGPTPKQLHLDFYVDDLAQLRPLLCLRRPGRPSILPVDMGQPRHINPDPNETDRQHPAQPPLRHTPTATGLPALPSTGFR